MLNIELVTRLSQSVYNLVPHYVDQTVAEVSNPEFKGYLQTQKLFLETLVVFHATSIIMGTDKNIETKRILYGQLAELADTFMTAVVIPRGLEYAKRFMKTMDADDFVVVFSEGLVQSSKMVAERVKSELTTAGVL